MRAPRRRQLILRRLIFGVAALGSFSIAAQAGPPYRTDDPEPVDYQHWEIYGFSAATGVKGDTSGILPGVEINYGVVPDMQLHLIAPLAFDSSSRSGTKFGYGDTELGVKYRFVQEDDHGWRPMVGIFPLLELPTGNAQRGLGTGHTHGYLPLWLQKSVGDWTTYGGGGYWINPGGGNKNYWFAGWLLQRKITDELTLAARSSTRRPRWSAARAALASTSAAPTTSPITTTCCSRPAPASRTRARRTSFRITPGISLRFEHAATTPCARRRVALVGGGWRARTFFLSHARRRVRGQHSAPLPTA